MEHATFLAISHFNDGSTSISLVEQELDPRLHCIKVSRKLDYNCFCHSCNKSAHGAKSRQKQLRHLKKEYIDSLKAREDNNMELVPSKLGLDTELHQNSPCTIYLLFFNFSILEVSYKATILQEVVKPCHEFFTVC